MNDRRLRKIAIGKNKQEARQFIGLPRQPKTVPTMTTELVLK